MFKPLNSEGAKAKMDTPPDKSGFLTNIYVRCGRERISADPSGREDA